MIRSKTYHPLNLFRSYISRLMLGFALLFLCNTLFAKDISISKDSLGTPIAQLSPIKVPEFNRLTLQNEESEVKKILQKTSSKVPEDHESEPTIYIAEGTTIYSVKDNIFATVTKLEDDTKDRVTPEISSKKRKIQVEKKIFPEKEYKNPIFKQVYYYHSTEQNSQFSPRDVSRKIAVFPNLHNPNREFVATVHVFQYQLFIAFRVNNFFLEDIFFKKDKALKTFYTRPPPFYM